MSKHSSYIYKDQNNAAIQGKSVSGLGDVKREDRRRTTYISRFMTAVMALVVSCLFAVGGQAFAQSGFPYVVDSCSANDVQGDLQNIRLTKACGCAGDTMEITFDLDVIGTPERYDIQWGIVTPDAGGGVTVQDGACLSDEGTPAWMGDLDGEGDCWGKDSKSGGLFTGITAELACDGDGDGLVDKDISVSAIMGWVAASKGKGITNGDDHISGPKSWQKFQRMPPVLHLVQILLDLMQPAPVLEHKI